MFRKKIGISIIAVCLILLFTKSISAYAALSNNYTLTGDPAEDIVRVALAQENKTQSELGYKGMWCDIFVKECASLAGVSTAIPVAGGVTNMRKAVITAGGVEVSEPSKGDLVFYLLKNSDEKYDHVGIMTSSSDMVSGNVNNKVYLAHNIQNVSDPRNFYVHTPGDCDYSFVRPNYSGNGNSDSGSTPSNDTSASIYDITGTLYAFGDWQDNISWKLIETANDEYTLAFYGEGAMDSSGIDKEWVFYLRSSGGTYTERAQGRYDGSFPWVYLDSSIKAKITNVIFEDGITLLPQRVCGNLSSLHTVVFGKEMRSIGTNSFSASNQIKTLIFRGAAVQYIGDFFTRYDNYTNYPSIVDIYYPGSKEHWDHINICSDTNQIKNSNRYKAINFHFSPSNTTDSIIDSFEYSIGRRYYDSVAETSIYCDALFLSKYVGTQNTITIPPTITIDDVTYTVLLSNTFKENNTIHKITIKPGVILSNSDYLFYKCENLEYADVSGVDASHTNNLGGFFSGCTKLRTIKLPNDFKYYKYYPSYPSKYFEHVSNCTIYYQGTIQEWNQLGYSNDYSFSNTNKIICSNGTIEATSNTNNDSSTSGNSSSNTSNDSSTSGNSSSNANNDSSTSGGASSNANNDSSTNSDSSSNSKENAKASNNNSPANKENVISSQKNTSISKVSAGKKSITIKWKKQTKNINGYEIQISTDKKFKKNVKTKTISSKNTTSKTINHLSADKKYYIRIRTYRRTTYGKTYSKWSKVKHIRTL